MNTNTITNDFDIIFDEWVNSLQLPDEGLTNNGTTKTGYDEPTSVVTIAFDGGHDTPDITSITGVVRVEETDNFLRLVLEDGGVRAFPCGRVYALCVD